ncbi:MAG: putative glycoside hydrolase [Lachnospiraceae bacterium]|nr:putative glycoside hydrolase [Lachnospiraceae bacterium]
MKRRLSLLLLSLILILSLVACGKSKDKDVDSGNATENAEDIKESEDNVVVDNTDYNAVVNRLIPKEKVRGIYVTGAMAGKDQLDSLIELIDKTDLNCMVIDVKDDAGNITYDMDLNLVKEAGSVHAYIKDIDALVKKLKEHNIYLIARIVCFKDPALAAGRPELCLRLPDGSPIVDGHGNAFVNPYSEEVHKYIVEVAKKAIGDGFDEIQFDYVRFPIGNDANNAEYGVDTTTYTRQKCISNFFSFAEREFHKEGIVFGADLFGTIIGSEIDEDATGQKYRDIAMKADVVCPMIYPSHYANGNFGLEVPDAKPYEAILGALNRSKKALSLLSEESCAIVRPWLQAFTAPWVEGHIEYDVEEVKKQIQAVYDAGYEEWILWNASNKYTYE